MFSVIGRMWQRGAMMAVVVRGNGAALASDVLGVITKEHVADSVALSVQTLHLNRRQTVQVQRRCGVHQ